MHKLLALRFTSAAVGLLLLLTACSANRKSRIHPPDRTLDIPFESHRFHADSGINIRLATGTEIRIDPGTLVDSKGNPVHGLVDFRIREFHRAEDMFRAGIPLNTRANGNQQLQSAGMMEMRAYFGQEELSVASGKSIGVGLAGFRDANGYDLWYMEEDADWNIRGNFRTDSNRIKWQTIRALTDSLDDATIPPKEDARVFELVGNLEAAPYLKAYQNLKWRLDDSEPIERLLTDSRINWQKVSIKQVDKRGNLYALTFSQFDSDNPSVNKGMQKTLLASPLTSNANMKKRMKEYEEEVAELDRKRKERLEQLVRSQKESDLLQFFSADRLGIWNVDRLMKVEDCIPVVVHFDFEKSLPDSEKKGSIIALYDEENSVMQYKREEKGSSIYLQKGKAMRLIVLLPKEQVVLVDNASIQQALESGSKDVTLQTKRMSLRDFLMPQP
ncbi:MAG: hypothetical protein FJX92_02155 [Bacteroidetes bacterium]|nr:hypothetical protein [Bacteroidota bacterium]